LARPEPGIEPVRFIHSDSDCVGIYEPIKLPHTQRREAHQQTQRVQAASGAFDFKLREFYKFGINTHHARLRVAWSIVTQHNFYRRAGMLENVLLLHG
jgi:hypothetical protein